MERFDAFWIPGGADGLTMETLRVGEVECRYPLPTPALMEGTVRSLRAAGRLLSRRSVDEIAEAVDAAAARLAHAGDPLRKEANTLVTAATGYSQAMTTLVLDRMISDWRAPSIRRLLLAEIGDPAALDGFVPLEPERSSEVPGGEVPREGMPGEGSGGERGGDHSPYRGRRVRGYGPRLAFHVFAGNVPGVAVTSLVRALLVKAPSLGKLASGEPILPVLFARALHSVDPELARALAVTYWPGGSEKAEWRLMEAADLVVVYGGPEAAATYRSRVPPDHRLLIHGPRFSAGLVGRDALADDAALPARVAKAVAIFDQHGCVSPHSIWVEDPSGDHVDAFAEALAAAFEELETVLPRGRISAAEASTIQQERGSAEMRGHTGAVRVLSGTGTTWTVVLDRDPAFRPSCLNRFVHLHPVDALDQVPDLLAPRGEWLQSVALATSPQRRIVLADALARIGATRVTSFDRIPWPPPHWHHDGRGPLRELLRWVDLEG